jgi:sulfur carrier protein
VIITINGAPREVASTTLAELLDEVGAARRGSAAAVDREVIPRSEWGSFTLQDGQSVEILTAVQGG